MLSETRFAESFARSRVERGQGPVRIRRDLRRHGVSAEQVELALEAMAVDWFARATEVRERRFGEAPPADLRARSKQCRFLEYRGFTAEQIRAATGADD